ncbi:hypothetical protein ACMD2_18918 [Ananas comosus]|uniref:Uncharacterized protein n=1 Tax=Ananas comosus TaxID=4615 RepID=A0A199UMJ5_ANACO|nr:hypothetical protein ACMD2_18918 [Ananas comosus]
MAGTIVLVVVVVVVVVTPTPLRAAPSHPAFADDPAPLRREEYEGGRIVDISHAYRPDMPEWESARGIGRFLWLRRAMANGSLANFSELKLPTHTGTHLMWKKECDTSYVGFMKDGAQWLVDNTDIKLVGMDYLSVAAYDDLAASHLVFLKSRLLLVSSNVLE